MFTYKRKLLNEKIFFLVKKMVHEKVFFREKLIAGENSRSRIRLRVRNAVSIV